MVEQKVGMRRCIFFQQQIVLLGAASNRTESYCIKMKSILSDVPSPLVVNRFEKLELAALLN